jgi:hypothetical protein
MLADTFIVSSVFDFVRQTAPDHFIFQIFRLHRICSRRYIVIIFPSLLLITTGSMYFHEFCVPLD